MSNYTVIYMDTTQMGSHQSNTVRMMHVQAKSVQAAFNAFEGKAVYVFAGLIQPEVVG